MPPGSPRSAFVGPAPPGVFLAPRVFGPPPRPAQWSASQRGDAVSSPPETDFAELYRTHFDLVWRALRRYGVAPDSLEDALQEVFLVVHRRLESFEGRSSLRTWIFGIARRVARDHRASAQFEMTEPALLEQHSTDDATDERTAAWEASRLLHSLLSQLAPDRRELLVLVELEQMTVAEAAQVLGENANTLQSRLRQARAELAQAWERQQVQNQWRQSCATNPRA